MNYYVPYFNMYPNTVTPTLGATSSGGLFKRLLGGINWSNLLNNTQKTLGIVNQAIPVFKQVSPVVKNAKTMFKVMNEFKREDNMENNLNNELQQENITEKTTIIENEEQTIGPTFFIK